MPVNDPTKGEAPEEDFMTHLPLLLRPEPARVILRPFIPADDRSPSGAAIGSRAARIAERILSLDSIELTMRLQRVMTRLTDRHRDVERVLQRRFHEMTDPATDLSSVSPEQALLIGAYFTEEYSFEAAALFNPSIVVHPDQSNVPTGSLRIVLSLRGVGEGHISSIIFRTGLWNPDGELLIDPPSAWATSPHIEMIPGGAPDDPGVRLFYDGHGDLSEVVVFPVTLRQRHGLEDLRLVQFIEDDGLTSYLGTYTAFSGDAIRQELLRTNDFKSFDLNALRGPASITKGMALFPRRIDGRFAMLGRQDHENIWLIKSNDLYNWDDGAIVIKPRWPWEFVQIGNCGPPIEIDEGWLLITHGVGAVRNYCLGACLLDKRDPSKVLARLSYPLVSPTPEDRDGYVPNVVYSCGALVHERTLLLPYGVADSFSAFATVPLDLLLRAMR